MTSKERCGLLMAAVDIVSTKCFDKIEEFVILICIEVVFGQRFEGKRLLAERGGGRNAHLTVRIIERNARV